MNILSPHLHNITIFIIKTFENNIEWIKKNYKPQKYIPKQCLLYYKIPQPADKTHKSNNNTLPNERSENKPIMQSLELFALPFIALTHFRGSIIGYLSRAGLGIKPTREKRACAQTAKLANSRFVYFGHERVKRQPMNTIERYICYKAFV